MAQPRRSRTAARAAAAVPRSRCPINLALESFGDSWSLLIVRDLMFRGRHRYGEFLSGGERIATNILADRLQRLEGAGMVEKTRDPADARQFLYRLTEKGAALAPMLVEMIVWSARYHETDAPAEEVEAMTRDRRGYLARLRRRLIEAGMVRAPGTPQ